MTRPPEPPGRRPGPEDLERLAGSGAEPGLCATCRHARILSSRTSAYLRCRMAELDPSFPRYPRLPVLACRGHERGP